MLTGLSILGSENSSSHGSTFFGMNPATGEKLEPAFFTATPADVDRAAELAEEAFASYGKLPGKERAHFLRTIADQIQAISESLVKRANLETALPVPRLQGEVGRTANQLRMFADVIEEGSWTSARIDTALPERKPLPRPDIRSILLPLGPVAVFGASNFPLAFSVAGGDTASALAAGNPVVVKAHPAHPGTSELVGHVIRESVAACGLHPGVFSMLFDSGIEIGKKLLQHPLMRAVGFTGSLSAGKALMQLAANRPEPIPCYAEMSSANPVFILAGALKDYEKVAADLTTSYTLGAGQFCTKPGLVLLPVSENTSAFVEALRTRAATVPEFAMLTAGIAGHYKSGLQKRLASDGVRAGYCSGSAGTTAALLETDADHFLSDAALEAEIFGPTSLVVTCRDDFEMMRAARSLSGHLTATVLGTEADLAAHAELIAVLERKVGRVIFNGYPTGVEVCHAMVHGGPYPATSDSRTTSVGSMAIFRFARPVCYQNLPQSVLPAELKDSNPLGVMRLVNGELTREPVTK